VSLATTNCAAGCSLCKHCHAHIREAAESSLREALALLGDWCKWYQTPVMDGGAHQRVGIDEESRALLAKHASTPREAPLPPEVLADALQDRVHPTSGRLLSASPVQEARVQGLVDALEEIAEDRTLPNSGIAAGALRTFRGES
jgi:hypothetical protein